MPSLRPTARILAVAPPARTPHYDAPVDTRHIRDFWDARAREDAFFFVDDRLEYGRPDTERFWADGESDLDSLLERAGARVSSDDDVVDVGCGLGRLSRALSTRAATVTAVDVSAEMLAQAARLNDELENVTWVHGDGASLRALPDASADAVVSHVVFQHIPDPQITYGYVRDMGRVLRPTGWAALHVSDDPSVHRPRRGRARLVHRLRAALGRAPRGQGDPAWLGSAIDLDDLRRAAEAGGCAVEHVDGAGTQFCYVRLRRRR